MRPTGKRARRLTLALAVAVAPIAAAAHPHMFVDARTGLLADAEGRLVGLRTALLIDPLTTLFVLEDHEIGPDSALTEAQRREIAEGIVEGLRDYDFFTELRLGEMRLGFAHVEVVHLSVQEERLAATLALTLADPIDLKGRTLELAVYDPTYYAAVSTVAAPVLPPELSDCSAALRQFEPGSLDRATLFELSQLSREETPEDPRIGARFADRGAVTCPS